MVSRAIAAVLVLVLVGPSVVAATCELTCAMASHHHDSSAPAASSCHEHQGSSDVDVSTALATPCHDSGDLPSAVVDAWLNSVVVQAAVTAPLVIGPAVTATPIVRSPDPRPPSAPRPPHRPLRV